MATIDQQIAPYTKVPQRTSPATFSEDADIFLTEQVVRFEQLNTFGSEANALRDEVNTLRNATETDKNTTVAAKDTTLTARDTTLGYKNEAETFKNQAQTAKNEAEAIYDNFDDRYLGAKATEPTVDNDGNALQSGALYYNTTNDSMFVYDLNLVQWIDIAYVPTLLSGLSDVLFSSLTDGDVIRYDATEGKWFNSNDIGTIAEFESALI